METEPNLEADSVDGPKTLEDVEMLIMEPDDDGSGETRRMSWYGMVGKKTASQGLMDIALITANANQLRYLLEFNRKSGTFHITIGFIIVSLVLQVVVGMILIFKGHYYLSGKSKCSRAKLMKNLETFCVFLISIVNVLITSFTTMAHD